MKLTTMKTTTMALCLLTALTATAQQRREINLSDGWQFSQDKASWQQVSVPHDWAISGPFDKKWDLQVVRIEQNGEKEATEKSGRSGALPWIGKGYYRRTLNIPAGYSRAQLVFDGAMAEPRVSLNGKEVGYWAYGYNTFRVELNNFKAGDNLLEVSLQNLEESSRWYPGAGIYRPVTLVLTGRDRLDPWDFYFHTTAIENNRARIAVTARAERTEANAIEVELRDERGRVADAHHAAIGKDGRVDMQFEVNKPQLWSPEHPYLYKAVVKLMKNGKTVDAFTRNVGIRTVRVSKEHGFELNGVRRKIKGVCLHHDLGPLGAAVNKAALIRQIKTMKDMGCDAIRTAHNMPSQMQMDVCDSLGMMVMAESFDMWIYPKCKNGYARFFKEWSDKDITNLVLANRNHPSIVMWSIGNEIPEQWDPKAIAIIDRLQGLCHRLDPSRPVTQGMDRIDNAIKSGFAQAMDVPGMNYRVHKYLTAFRQLKQGFLLGSETASTVSSRGVYKFPVKPTDKGVYADGQCSGYDVEWCPWSNLPDDDWRMQDDYPWVIGEFVWTGYDYLGEPTPYDEYWPSRSSYFGICDLAGLPKDRYWLYRSHWQKGSHTLHLLPHWSWGTSKNAKRGKKGKDEGVENRIGQVTPVYCYTDYPEAELFVNGKSQGRIKKNTEERLDRYRLRWNNVVYEPGELHVVAYDKQGKVAAEQTICTPGKPDHLQLDVWTQQSKQQPYGDGGELKADGDDLAFVTVSLVDYDGTLIPEAQDQLTFEVEGAGTFRAVCNGDATSLESFTKPTMRLFNGQLVVVVQAAKTKGNLILRVKDAQRNLSSEAKINVK